MTTGRYGCTELHEREEEGFHRGQNNRDVMYEYVCMYDMCSENVEGRWVRCKEAASAMDDDPIYLYSVPWSMGQAG